MVNIISRAEWGARSPTSAFYYPPSKPTEIYLHHTVGSGARDKNGDGDLGDDYMRSVQIYHQDTKGWKDVAYNFLIDPDGLEVYEGRGWGAAPGAQAGHNVGTWAVAIMGDFRTHPVSDDLRETIASLVRYGQELGELPELTPLLGHRDAPGSEWTHCPGDNLYSSLDEINRLILKGEDVALSQEDKDWLLAAISGDNISQTDSIWKRYVIRNSAGKQVPLLDAIQFIYQKLESGVEVDADDILDRINLKQAA